MPPVRLSPVPVRSGSSDGPTHAGFAAEGNGSNLMSEAEAKAAEIRAQFR